MRWLPLRLQHHLAQDREHVPMVLVGNKYDEEPSDR
jgi:GTPase SAR1 family protein